MSSSKRSAFLHESSINDGAGKAAKTIEEQGPGDLKSWLQEYLRTNFDICWSGENATLSELGLDSISLASLLSSLEDSLKIVIPIDFAMQHATINEFLAALDQPLRKPSGLHCNSANGRQSLFKTHVNRGLATKLEQLRLNVTFVRGQGSYLYDQDGRSYIDFMAQYGALPFGHHPTEIWSAIDQLRSDAEPIFAQPSLLDSAGQLAKRLIDIAPPGLQYVTFSNSGAEAVEAALKLARSATGRKGILSTYNSYHGKTLGALSATGNANYHQSFGAPAEDFACIEYGNINALAEQLSTRPDYFAALILEPIQGEGGMIEPPSGYLQTAKDLCHQYGTLLIIDEVQTGLGRTGSFFACDREKLSPDIMTVAKALGGGVVPIGATMASEAVQTRHFELKHSSTFAGNSLAARVGLATIDILTKEDGAMIKRVEAEGTYLKTRLQQLQQKYPRIIKDVRGIGFMLGIEFTSDRSFWYENFLGIAAENKELAQFVSSYLLNVEGVRLAPTLNGGNVLRIQPPLNTCRQEIDDVIAAIDRTLLVLDQHQTGILFRGILNKSRTPLSSETGWSAKQENGDLIKTYAEFTGPKFAFLLHPLEATSYAEYDASLSILNDDELDDFAQSMDGLIDPVIGSSVHIKSKNGTTVAGDFIMISHTADQLKRMSVNDALEVLRKGLELAKTRRAKICGLGAYTSIVSSGGTLLREVNIPLTTGNSYTVSSSLELLDSVIHLLNRSWSQQTACILGATGAIGRCISALLAERANRLVLIGNGAQSAELSREKLTKTALYIIGHIAASLPKTQPPSPGSLYQHIAQMLCSNLSEQNILKDLETSGRLILSTNARLMALADVIVTATSDPKQQIASNLFKKNAIICDISRPRTIHAALKNSRPDLTVVDGGIISLPHNPRIGPYGLPVGTSYACMAETILLALDGHYHHTSLGQELEMSEIRRQQQLAEIHGFSLAGYQSFGKILSSQELIKQSI